MTAIYQLSHLETNKNNFMLMHAYKTPGLCLHICFYVVLCFVLQILRLPVLLPVQDSAVSSAIYYVKNVCFDSKERA